MPEALSMVLLQNLVSVIVSIAQYMYTFFIIPFMGTGFQIYYNGFYKALDRFTIHLFISAYTVFVKTVYKIAAVNRDRNEATISRNSTKYSF